MLCQFMRYGREAVALEFLHKQLIPATQANSYQLLTYPNNVHLYFLYYGSGFIPKDRSVARPSLSPIRPLVRSIIADFEEHFVAPTREDKNTGEFTSAEKLINVL